MKILFKHFRLICSLTRRDIEVRYRGTSLGLAWALLNPVIMLTLYTFIFGFVFKAKWGVTTGSNYTLIMFVGLLTHGFVAECLGKATNIYLYNVSYVKKVLFPLEALCWVTVLSAAFQFLMGSIIFSIFCVVLKQSVTLMALLVPIVLLPLIILTYGVSLFLSSMGVYFRDMGQIIAVVIAILLFMSPVFFHVTAIPEQYRFIIYFNPLTFIIESLRDVVLYDRMFSLKGYVIYCAAGTLVYCTGLSWFKKVKRGFADVL